jgi:hypothetical protein
VILRLAWLAVGYGHYLGLFIFLVLALLLLANIVTIALTRDPWGLAIQFVKRATPMI